MNIISASHKIPVLFFIRDCLEKHTRHCFHERHLEPFYQSSKSYSPVPTARQLPHLGQQRQDKSIVVMCHSQQTVSCELYTHTGQVGESRWGNVGAKWDHTHSHTHKHTSWMDSDWYLYDDITGKKTKSHPLLHRTESNQVGITEVSPSPCPT